MLQEVILKIIKHHKENPTHEINCACMDEYIKNVRYMTTISDRNVQQRIDYVIRMGLENRT